MAEEGLRQVGHCSDLVKFMDRVFVAVVVDDKWEDSLRRGGYARANAVALEGWTSLQGHRALPVQSCCGPFPELLIARGFQQVGCARGLPFGHVLRVPWQGPAAALC